MFPLANAQEGSQISCLKFLKEAKDYDYIYTILVFPHTKEAIPPPTCIHTYTVIGENLKFKGLNRLLKSYKLLCFAIAFGWT